MDTIKSDLYYELMLDDNLSNQRLVELITTVPLSDEDYVRVAVYKYGNLSQKDMCRVVLGLIKEIPVLELRYSLKQPKSFVDKLEQFCDDKIDIKEVWNAQKALIIWISINILSNRMNKPYFALSAVLHGYPAISGMVGAFDNEEIGNKIYAYIRQQYPPEYWIAD